MQADYKLLWQFFSPFLISGGAVFILPQCVLKDIVRKCRDFLTAEKRREIALVSWDQVCLPMKNGGLNVNGCCNWNIASVGKLLWQVAMKVDVLWVNGVYMKNNGNIWEHVAPANCSSY